MAKLVRVKNFYSRAEAEMAKEILEAHGIQAVIQLADSFAALHYVDRSGESDLLVQESDLSRASDVLLAYMENSR